MQKLLLTSVFLVTAFCGFSQSDKPWNHKSCAVVLTYDDALNVDLDHAIPVLDSLGLKATFYLSGYSGVLNNRLEEWREIAKEGHELGNHTLYHPCTSEKPGRSFVSRRIHQG